MIAKIYTIIGISIVGWVFLFSLNFLVANPQPVHFLNNEYSMHSTLEPCLS